MKIYDLQSAEELNEWSERIRACDWDAARLLADLIDQNRFYEVLGDGSILLMADDEKVVSFCTLAPRDCVDDDTLYPWIGFVFTAPEYRGNRYGGKLIEYACQKAAAQGHNKAYIATDHIGLYEKYGFTYIESRIDIYNDISRIYVREI